MKREIGCAHVYLVGAGPGDPALLVLRGAECLSMADVVLYDYLVNPALLEHAPASAELVALGHHSTGSVLTPGEIMARMIAEARRGRTVVRLKGGDPMIFGRGGDETEALREAGVPFEVVPGITAALAVAATCEIPVTHHGDASAVALITGRERSDKKDPHLDYKALAGFPGTLIVYMGVRQAERWSAALIDNGKSPDTPVAIVRWCTRARQQTIRCTLGTVAEVVGRRMLQPPALFVVGEVVARAPQLSWFASRPLFGTRILVAGAPTTSRRLRNRMTNLGADVLMQPVVNISGPPDWSDVDDALESVALFDWLVFTSPNGVDSLLTRVFDRGDDIRALGGIRIAAIGSGTVERLNHYHVHPELAPPRFNVAALARRLVVDEGGRRILLAGTNRGRPVLGDELSARGAVVKEVVVYSTEAVREPDPEVEKELELGEIDWIAVTSATTARSLDRLYGDLLRSSRIASISPMTSRALVEMGYQPAVQASPHTLDALVDAMRPAVDDPGGWSDESAAHNPAAARMVPTS